MCEQKVLGNNISHANVDQGTNLGLLGYVMHTRLKKSQPLYERPHFPPLATLFPSIAKAGLQIVINVIYS